MRNTEFFIIVILLLVFLYPNFLLAEDYSSSNFILRDPVITVEGGESSSSSFQYFSSSGQTASGQSASSNFIYKAGFLYFSSSSTSDAEATVTTTIDSASGGDTTLTSTNNAEVVFSFPSNFYSEDLELQGYSYANDYFSSSKPAVSGKDFIGKTYDFNLYTSSDTQVYTVSVPITITIDYLASDVSGIDENTLSPYRWGANDSSWQLISGYTLDTANNKVTFSTSSFSSFALFGSSQQPGGASVVESYFSYFLPPYFLPPLSFSPKGADLNGDGKIDIVDLSILLYYFDKPAPAPEKYDFNNDGKVDIVDISILLFYWT